MRIVLSAMDVLGAYVRIEDKRFVVGFSLVRDDAVAASWTFTAPTATDVGEELAELYEFTYDRLRQSAVERLSLLFVEVPHGKAEPKRTARRAEGAILAAAGNVETPVSVWSDRAFTGGGTVQAAVDAFCERVSGAPHEEERRRATGAAVASIERPDH
jgi:hypothetical protein